MIAIVAVLILLAALALSGAGNPLVVRMTDQCNPATFNAALHAPVCSGDGTITFDHFIKELTNAQKVGAWHFDPENTTVEPGTALQLTNTGGETHTFTKVKNFAGGFVPILNQLSGNPVPAPECGTVTQGGIIPKPESPLNIFVEAGTTENGPTAGGAFLPNASTTKIQCCIHPWMRMEIRTR